MKRIFIAFALLLICLSAAGAELWYIGNTADSFTRRIEKIDALMMKDDFTKASKLCGEVSSDWDKTASFLDTLLIHDYIASIGINLSQMKTHIDSCCPDMYFAGSAGAKKGLASIKGSEYPKFDNIF